MKPFSVHLAFFSGTVLNYMKINGRDKNLTFCFNWICSINLNRLLVSKKIFEYQNFLSKLARTNFGEAFFGGGSLTPHHFSMVICQRRHKNRNSNMIFGEVRYIINERPRVFLIFVNDQTIFLNSWHSMVGISLSTLRSETDRFILKSPTTSVL